MLVMATLYASNEWAAMATEDVKEVRLKNPPVSLIYMYIVAH